MDTQKEHRPYGLRSLWSGSDNLNKFSPIGLFLHLSMQAWRTFLASPLTSLLTIMTIAISLTVLASFILVVENFETILASTQRNLQLSIYLKDSTPREEVEKMASVIKSSPEVDEVNILSKADALNAFRESLGSDSVILEGFGADNPLPGSLEVRFKQQRESETIFQKFANDYEKDPRVELVQYNRGLLGQLGAAVRYFRVGGALAIALLLIITGFIISNTITLALHSHRDEIEIMRLVGATDAFVRAPFVIEGFVQGLIGGTLSLLLLYICFVSVERFIHSEELLVSILPDLHFLGVSSTLLVLLVGMVVGLGGSFLSVKRFITTKQFRQF